jgi:hypothetical protein
MKWAFCKKREGENEGKKEGKWREWRGGDGGKGSAYLNRDDI